MKRALWKKAICAMSTVIALAGAASGAIYQWTGTGVADNYTDPDNWCITEPCGTTYPDDSGDDALFPVILGATGYVWGDVNLDFTGTTTIDDMTILDGVDFLSAATTPDTALVVDIFVIDASNAAVAVTFRDEMTFTASP